MLSTNLLTPFTTVVNNNEEKEDKDKAKVYTFDTRVEMDNFAKKDERDLCFGLYFKKVDRANFDYEVVTSVNKFATVDTNLPLIRPLITKPDMAAFD